MTSKSSASKTAASKPTTVTFSPYLMRRNREALADWLHANGIDPNTVSADHAIRLVGDTIWYHAFDLDPAGRRVADWEAGEMVTVERTAHCTKAAPRLTPSDDETD
ncbi:hypothetical protein [Streptomyces sp. NPDC126499]|uniref:hypothetical protein n=1 Tax=Streptomyces sp. NPDC126499 TaxID=3155314 RepID=UPI0033342F69